MCLKSVASAFNLLFFAHVGLYCRHTVSKAWYSGRLQFSKATHFYVILQEEWANSSISKELDSVLINVLDSKLRCHVFKSPPDQKFGSSFLPHLHRKVLSLLKRLDKKTFSCRCDCKQLKCLLSESTLLYYIKKDSFLILCNLSEVSYKIADFTNLKCNKWHCLRNTVQDGCVSARSAYNTMSSAHKLRTWP